MKKTPVLIGTILILLLIIANSAYAYFASSINIDDGFSVEAIFDSTSPAFTAYTAGDLDLEVYSTDMLEYSQSPRKSAQGLVKVDALSNSGTLPVLCTYDIDLVWETDSYIPSAVLPDQDEEGNNYPYELSIKASRATTGDDAYTYSNKNLSEINISNLTFNEVEGKKRANLIKGAEIHNQSADSKSITTWTFTLNFYTIPSSQQDLLGKTFKSHLEVTNTVC